MDNYVIPAHSVVHEVDLQFGANANPTIIHLTQYDQSIPLLAVRLWDGSNSWLIPEGATVNLRMQKPDGKHVYNSALGVSEDSKTVYIAVTAQMTAAAGKATAIIEVLEGVGIIGTGTIIFSIAKNPVPDSAYDSTDEYKTLMTLITEVKEIGATVAENVESAKEASQVAVDAADRAIAATSYNPHYQIFCVRREPDPAEDPERYAKVQRYDKFVSGNPENE